MICTFDSFVAQTVLCLIIVSGIVKARHLENRRTNQDASNGGVLKSTPISPDVAAKVNVTIYYETHCPHCINFFRNRFGPSVVLFAPYMNINMIPYGNARITIENGQYRFECQHGAIECYGNTLHACAIDIAQNNTKAALFNTCMMTRTYSFAKLNDYVAWCAWKFNIPRSSIRQCVNGERGSILLNSYGEQTRALGLNGVPHLTLNGSPSNFLEYDLCRLIKPTPNMCISTFGYIFS